MNEISSAAAANGHRLVLFDIDGTLLSAGRVARESVLAALTRAYGWQPLPEHQDRERHDFSGKTDPQIVRELVIGALGRDRVEEGLSRALDLYLEELGQRLKPDTIVLKPGVSELLARLSAQPGVTLGLLTGNLERGARLKLEPPRLNSYFPFGAFGSDSSDRYELPTIALERAWRHTGRRHQGKSVVIVGDSIHDVGCGRALGVRAVAVATGPTPAERLAAERPDALVDSFADVDLALEAILS
jgi:phosphoglycolate phosphatase-like HAD superfamily hydrolase